MKVGVWIPCYRAWVQGSEVLAMAKNAEQLGFESLWVQDHLIAPVGDLANTRVEKMAGWLPVDEYGGGDYTAVEYYGQENWWLDPYVLWGFLAGCTSTVTLASCVVVLPYRDPIVQAKMLGTLDVLSGGRMLFGVGAGHVEAEFDAVGVPFTERGPRTDEYIRIIKTIVAGEQFSYDGEFIKIPESKPLITAVQRPAPPVFVGGNSKRAIRRAVELGEGWLPANISAADLPRGIEYLREVSEAAGTAVPDTGMVLVLGMRDPRAPFEGSSLRRFYTVEEAADMIRSYRELGVAHLAIDVPNPNLAVVHRQTELLAEALALSLN